VLSYVLTHNSHIAQLIGFDSIAAGCVLAFIAPGIASSQRWHRVLGSHWFFLVPVIGILTHLVGSKGVRWSWAFDIGLGQTTVAIAIALSIAWCLNHSAGVVIWLLNVRAIRWIGVLSYSIYLWQEVFLWQGSPMPLWLAAIASLIAATASYLLVERPSLLLRRKIEKVVGWGKLPAVGSTLSMR
jgi:peptidoglycan/LPS O-acetylase OafA/YrhL